MNTDLPTGPGQVPDYDDDPFAPRQDHEDTSELNGRRVTIAPTYSDEAIALGFVDKYEAGFRYVTQFGRWYVWDGKRWAEDVQLRVNEFIRNECRENSNRVNNKPGLARSIASAKTSSGVERLLRSEQKINLLYEHFDRETMLLNTPTGVVDLSTGVLMPHAREYYMTKMTAVGPSDMATPKFNKFLAEVTLDRAELGKFLQRVAGYCLTGEIKEHAMFFLYGTGTNGKSVFISTLFKILADYACMSPIETFMATQDNQHPQGLASLMGARMVWTTEIEEGKRWSHAKITAATGGDPITARFMRQDQFTFLPTFKITSLGNFKPQFRSVGPAIRRRMNLIPFDADFTGNINTKLEEELRSEWPGILRWAIDGCVDWHRNGLQHPDVIKEATKSYLDAEDTTQNWISECLVSKPNTSITQENLWRSWEAWSKARGDHPGTMKRLIANLEQKGYGDYWGVDDGGVKVLRDIGVKDGAPGFSSHADPGPSGGYDSSSMF